MKDGLERVVGLLGDAEATALLASVLDRERVGVAVYVASGDGDFVYAYVNDAFQAMKPHVPMLGRTYSAVWPEIAGEVLPRFRRIAETGEPWIERDRPFEVEERPGELGTRHYTYETTLLRKDDPALLLITATDTTDEVTARERAASLFEELRASLEEQRASAEELGTRSEQLQALLDALPVAVFIADADGRIVYTNGAASDLWGPLPPTPDADAYGLYKGWWPDTGERLKAADWAGARALSGQTIVGEAVDIERFDCAHRTILNSALPIRNDQGRITGTVTVEQDITEHRQRESALERSEDRFRLLSEANAILLSAEDAEATIQVIADQVLRHLGADVFFNYVLDPGADRLRLNAWGGVDQRVAKMIERLELGQAICGCVARDGERIISIDVQNNGDPRADLVRRMGVRCYCCHPLKVAGHTVGTLSFGTKSKDRFDDDEIEFMRTVANQISIAMQRARTEEQVRRAAEEQASLAEELRASLEEQLTLGAELDEQRAQLQAVVDNIAEGLIILRPDGSFQPNDAYARINGFASKEESLAHLAEYEGSTVRDASGHLCSLEEWPASRALRGERFSNEVFEIYVSATGRRFTGAYNGAPIRNEDGDVVMAVLTMRDVSQEHERERELEFRSFLLESVSDSVFAYPPDGPDKGRLVYVNDAAAERRGYRREDLLGMNVIDVIAPEWRPLLDGRLDKLAAGEEVRAESAHVRKDGTSFPVEVRLRQVRFGERTLVVNVARDITDRKQAEERLRRSLQTTQLLLRGASTVAMRVGVEDVLQELAELMLDAIDHTRVTMSLVDRARGEVRSVLSAGVGAFEPVVLPFETLSPTLRRVVDTGKTAIADYDALPPRYSASYDSHLALQASMRYQDRIVGIIAIDDPGERREFSADEIEFVEGIAAQAAVAIENGRLLQAEQEALATAEREAAAARSLLVDNARLLDAEVARSHRERVLKEILVAATASLDLRETGRSVVERLASELEGAAVMILLADARGERLEVLAQAGYDPGLVEKATPVPIDAETETVDAFREGLPRYVADALTSAVAPETRRLAEIQSLRSAANLPISLHGAPIGVLALAWPEPRSFTEEEESFLESLASEIALGVSNARAYQSEHDIADRLQEALLALPESVDGIEFAHSYRSAMEAARVGGDFYDIFEIEHHLIGVTIGDVAGKGLDAAVLTSLVKNTIRAHANDRNASASSILTLANDVIQKATSTEAFVTVFFGILDCETGRLAYSSAGHTTGAILHSDGKVEGLPATGPLLGAFGGVTFGRREASISCGEVIFLFTDGLTEARQGDEQYGEQRVMAVLSASRETDPVRVIREVVSDVTSFAGGEMRDDMALLAVRCVGPDAETSGS